MKLPQFYLALADTNLLTMDGTVSSFEDLADRTTCKEHICAYSKGKMTEGTLSDPIFNMEHDSALIITLTLNTGESFKTLLGSKMLLSDGTWLTAEDLHHGDTLKTFTYNPLKPHPQATPKVIRHINAEWSSFAPTVQYEASCSKYLLTVDKEEHNKLLIPTQSVPVNANVFA